MTPNLGARAGLVVVLAAGTLLLPWPVASWVTGTGWGGPADLAHAVGVGLVHDWTRQVDPGTPGSTLAGPIEFWRWFHLTKAVLAGLLLAGSTAPWATRRPRVPGSRPIVDARRVAGVIGGTGACVALLVVLANVQGAIAPLSSVLSLLPIATGTGGLSDAAGALAVDVARGDGTGLGRVLVDDFAAYHAVLAALAVGSAATLLVVSVRRRRHRSQALAIAAAAASLGVLAWANLGTALDPAPAMASFLRDIAG